jgi:hypothetical protein
MGAQKGGHFRGSRRQRGKQEGGDIKSMIQKAKNHKVTNTIQKKTYVLGKKIGDQLIKGGTKLGGKRKVQKGGQIFSNSTMKGYPKRYRNTGTHAVSVLPVNYHCVYIKIK